MRKTAFAKARAVYAEPPGGQRRSSSQADSFSHRRVAIGAARSVQACTSACMGVFRREGRGVTARLVSPLVAYNDEQTPVPQRDASLHQRPNAAVDFLPHAR